MVTTAAAAGRVGVSKNTLLRWIGEGRLPDTARDSRNWRVWSEADIARAVAVRDALHGESAPAPRSPAPVAASVVEVAGRSPQPAGSAPVAVAAKRAQMALVAEEMSRHAEGRAKRAVATVPVESLKSRIMPLIAQDMDKLGEGRLRRAK